MPRVQSAPLKAQDLIRRALQDTPLTQMEAGEVVKRFVKTMNRHLYRVESTSSQELSDSIDFVVVSQSSSSTGLAQTQAQSSFRGSSPHLNFRDP